jgi:hypothetical protein
MQSTTRVMILFDEDKVARVKSWCKKRSITFSEFVRKAVDELYERANK